MNTRDLHAFVAVVETGSIVRAATILHLTQPGVTRRIQSLESLLGIALLDRDAKPLRPTAAGQEVYQRGRRLLESVEEFKLLGHADQEPTGELRLGVPPFLADMALAEPIDRLRERYAQLRLRIHSAWSIGLVQRLEQNTLDMAVVAVGAQTLIPPSCISHRICKQPIHVIAAAALNLPKRPSLQTLSDFDWVLSQDGCGMRTALRHTMERQGLPFEITVETFAAELQLSLVARGAGLGLITPDLLAASCYRSKLKILDVPEFKSSVEFCLIHRPLPPRLQGASELLLEEMKKVMATRIELVKIRHSKK
ncbi:MAG: LysR family transcriptional regulator [Verrucomicrobiaceae bacterium]|nr:LysR family transcriptional regulator [Verrucomicrobiaceae bacterium]